MTFAEVLLWNELKQKKINGYDFDRQRPIDNYIVDFYCKDLMLAIEVDGFSHFTPEAIEEDEQRQNRLEELGVSVLRFNDSQVKDDIENVICEIGGWIEEWVEKNPDKVFPGRFMDK